MMLEKEPWTVNVKEKSVECGACTKTIRLDNRYSYYPGLWNKHRDTCRMIKYLEGKPIRKEREGKRSRKPSEVQNPSDSGAKKVGVTKKQLKNPMGKKNAFDQICLLANEKTNGVSDVGLSHHSYEQIANEKPDGYIGAQGSEHVLCVSSTETKARTWGSVTGSTLGAFANGDSDSTDGSDSRDTSRACEAKACNGSIQNPPQGPGVPGGLSLQRISGASESFMMTMKLDAVQTRRAIHSRSGPVGSWIPDAHDTLMNVPWFNAAGWPQSVPKTRTIAAAE
ncbi:hypothetical protein Hypma_011241 [Hypsizygus marmoreus]|uniref:Uncharacterized protein n=1 Tax=Hypsizygus marmoreus TaxID=39966 RepID=A0A369JJS0_HYPMA|nr:hypothetical protein Hypma_011241 [Hypsizygus marmoreus]